MASNLATRRAALACLTLALLGGCSASPAKRNVALQGLAPRLPPSAVEVVAELPRPPGNLAVGPDGRVYFTFHPEAEPPEVHLAVLREDGSVEPFPSRRWQTERDDGPWFVAPLGVRVDDRGRLWVLDHGDYGSEAPSLTAFDVSTREVLHRFVFPGEVADWGSMLNDFAVDATRGFVYIADPSPFDFDPAIVVYDIEGGQAWRHLEDHDSVEAEDHHVVVQGRFMRAYGLALQIGVDSIALSPGGEHLYYGPLAGGTLYRVPTAALRDPQADVEAQVSRHGPKPTTDGIVTGPDGITYLTAVEEDAIATLDPQGQLACLVRSRELLRWPDGVALSPDGEWLYATCSELHKVIGEDLDEVPAKGPYRIVRIPLKKREAPVSPPPPGPPPPPPPPPKPAAPPPALVEYVEAQGGDPSALTHEPHHTHGDFACFLGDIRGRPPRAGVAGRLFVSAEGVVARDGSGPWAAFLRAGDPAQTGKALERMHADRMSQLQTPARQRPPRVGEDEWALVADPTLEEADGALVFVAWFGSPPAFGPERLTVTVPAEGPARLEWEPAHRLVR